MDCLMACHTYPIRCQQGHSDCYPASLTRAQDEGFLDPQGGHDLQVHLCGIPVGKVFGFGARCAMTQELNREQVHGFGQMVIGILSLVEVGGGCERIHEDKSRLFRIVVVRRLVSSCPALVIFHSEHAPFHTRPYPA